jgi:protein O-GlcNAc transferase
MNPLLEQAREHHLAGRFSEAEQLYRQILASDPDESQAAYLLGVLYCQLGRAAEAVDSLRRATLANPQMPECHYQLGVALVEAEKKDEAIASFEQAIALRPSFADACNSLGNELRLKGDLEKAIAAHRCAIVYRPDVAGYWSNLGIALQANGEAEKAIVAFKKAVDVEPNFAAGRNNLGLALRQAGRIALAAAAFERALALKPDFAEAHNNLGTVLRDLGQLDKAIESYERAVGHQPTRTSFYSNLVLAQLYQPDRDPIEGLNLLKQWDDAVIRPLIRENKSHQNDRDPNRRLRVGYVSPDFGAHSVAYFLLGLFANHNPTVVEFFAYSDLAHGDEITQQLRRTAHHWRHTAGMNDIHLAELIREDKIDILFDLTGHTARNRLLVFARGPAPIQVTYLGYAATTGLRTMDYRLTDAYADPPGMTEKFHTEKLVRLPRSFLCYSPPPGAPEVGPPPALANGEITFGSFNHLAKISSATIQLWSEILTHCAKSRLLIKSAGQWDSATQESLLQQIMKQGMSADRVEFHGATQDVVSHLRMYEKIDIALDTFPYNGTATTCEAMWMGLPVITLAGKTHVSRVGVGLLSNAGMGEGIAQTSADYVKKAIALAGDIGRLAEFRAGQRERIKHSPLMDAKTFTRDLENVLRDLWRRWVAG